jgi:ribonuclease P protein component
MIKKKYRLTEREFRKVLSRKKPFFSYLFVANTTPNTLSFPRLGILLPSKCANGSVNRNFFRRKFYDIFSQKVGNISSDIVLVPKKWTILDYTDANCVAEFEKNIMFLARIIRQSGTPKRPNPVETSSSL